MRQISNTALCLVVVLSAGCMSVPSNKFAMEITSEPSGAEIWTRPTPARIRGALGPLPTPYKSWSSHSVNQYGSGPMLIGKTPYRADLCFIRGGLKQPWQNMEEMKGGTAFNLFPWSWLASTNSLAPNLFAVSGSFMDLFLVTKAGFKFELDFTLRKEGCEDTLVHETLSEGSCLGFPFYGPQPKALRRAAEGIPAEVRRNYSLKRQAEPVARQPEPSPAQQPASGSVAERLKKLQELHSQGLISNEDYESKKKTILNDL